MKPILQTVIDKNGKEEQQFSPSPKMILYSIYKGRNPAKTEQEVCELAGLDSQLPGRWSRKYGSYYTDWLDEAIDGECGQDAALVLERVGMIQATQKGNYQYWRDLARKHGVIQDEVKPAQITINTDFTAILAMGDLNAARTRILQELRGVGIPAGSRVVDVTPVGEHKGPGTRASEVQGRSMALPNSLGSNRGRPEQGSSLPALSQQDTSPSAYDILDEGAVPSDPQIPPVDHHMAVLRPVPVGINVLSIEDDLLSE